MLSRTRQSIRLYDIQGEYAKEKAKAEHRQQVRQFVCWAIVPIGVVVLMAYLTGVIA